MTEDEMQGMQTLQSFANGFHNRLVTVLREQKFGAIPSARDVVAKFQYFSGLLASEGMGPTPTDEALTMIGISILYLGHAALVRAGGTAFANKQHETLLEAIEASKIWSML